MLIKKRNGVEVEFDKNKIINAIMKSMAETDKGENLAMAEVLATMAEIYFEDSEITPTVEEISDKVEELLAEAGRFDAAKTYILYREKRHKLRSEGWDMTDLQKDIYEQKYRFNNESFEEFLERTSGGNQPIKKALKSKEIMPAGRILAGRGLDKVGRKITLSNCYVLPKVGDSIEEIFDAAKHLARTYSYGGGVGMNISKLRPKGSKVNNSASFTTGAVSFMELYSMVTGLIGQNGRRGALMLNMDCSHPDIEEFIGIKTDLNNVTKANISININDEFMKAVVYDKKYELYFKIESSGEEIKKKVDAKKLFKIFAETNWDYAEPAILNQDRINSWHLMSEDPTFEYAGVNPCAEEPLPAFGSCNLASINLSEFVINSFEENASFDFDRFGALVRNGVIYLNEVLDENMKLHPLEGQKEVSRDLRQIGLVA